MGAVEDGGGSVEQVSEPGLDAARNGCAHPSHRVLRLFLSYAEANVVRVSCLAGSGSRRTVVSPLRRIEGGWSFSMCEACLLERSA
jgi:hypothetical protein